MWMCLRHFQVLTPFSGHIVGVSDKHNSLCIYVCTMVSCSQVTVSHNSGLTRLTSMDGTEFTTGSTKARLQTWSTYFHIAKSSIALWSDSKVRVYMEYLTYTIQGWKVSVWTRLALTINTVLKSESDFWEPRTQQLDCKEHMNHL